MTPTGTQPASSSIFIDEMVVRPSQHDDSSEGARRSTPRLGGLTPLCTKRQVRDALGVLSKRLGFRIGSGHSERANYREIVLNGLTTLDVSGETEGVAFSMDHVTARQELRELIEVPRLPALGGVAAATQEG